MNNILYFPKKIYQLEKKENSLTYKQTYEQHLIDKRSALEKRRHSEYDKYINYGIIFLVSILTWYVNYYYV